MDSNPLLPCSSLCEKRIKLKFIHAMDSFIRSVILDNFFSESGEVVHRSRENRTNSLPSQKQERALGLFRFYRRAMGPKNTSNP